MNTMVTLSGHELAMDVAILWDISQCSPYAKRFGGVFHFHPQGRKSAKQENMVWQVARQSLSFPLGLRCFFETRDYYL
jgi:hypothetical protein